MSPVHSNNSMSPATTMVPEAESMRGAESRLSESISEPRSNLEEHSSTYSITPAPSHHGSPPNTNANTSTNSIYPMSDYNNPHASSQAMTTVTESSQGGRVYPVTESSQALQQCKQPNSSAMMKNFNQLNHHNQQQRLSHGFGSNPLDGHIEPKAEVCDDVDINSVNPTVSPEMGVMGSEIRDVSMAFYLFYLW